MNAFVPTGGQTAPAPTPGETSPEHLLSQLLMGFVERNVSPHTICDIVRSQIMETRLSPHVLSTPTCNGIIEVLTGTAGVTGSADVLLFLSARSGFPQFLSSRALTGLVVFFLKQLASPASRLDPHRQHRMTSVVDGLARRIVAESALQPLNASEKMRILNALKTLPDEMRTWAAATAPSLELLRNVCSNEGPTLTRIAPAPALAEPSEALTAILDSGEHVLAQKGVGFFRTSPVSVSLEWRCTNLEGILDILDRDMVSDFRRGFLTEWVFDGMLRETLHNSDYLATIQRLTRAFVERHGQREAVLKGILRALQRDLSLTATEFNVPESQSPQFTQLMQRSSYFFTLLFPIASQNLQAFFKSFAHWALQMPVHPAESRLFTRTSWQWTRTLASGQWEDDLREPPVWVTSQASRFVALIFRMGPAFWLHDHGHVLIERLHLESIQAGFTASQQHFDYIEYLVRTLRKKSPFFASRSELLLALKLLGRATPHEDNQLRILETRFRMNAMGSGDPERQFWNGVFGDGGTERFGANAVTRALHVLLHALRIAAKSRRLGAG